MIALVVLIHDQAANLERLAASYKGLTVKPDLFVFVCDRCRDDSPSLIRQLMSSEKISVLEVWEESNFAAGKNRDIGLRHAESLLGPCDVVFLDGDCVPEQSLIKSHKEWLSRNASYPVVTIGLRFNETVNKDLAFIDNRLKHFKHSQEIFADVPRLVVSKQAAFTRMLTWSCNLGINAKAIELMRFIVDKLSGEARVFHPAFDGSWGGEDDFIGIMAQFLGAAVVSLPDASVNHIWHKSRQNDNYSRQVDLQTGRLNNLALQLRMPGVTSCLAVPSPSRSVRIASMTDINVRSPIVRTLLPVLSGNSLAYVAESLSAVVAFRWNKTCNPRPLEWAEAKEELDRQLKQVIHASALDLLAYEWKVPCSNAKCSICSSDKGYAPNGRCFSCGSFAWHRLMHKSVNSDLPQGLKIAFNLETAGELRSVAGWTCYSYKGLFKHPKADLTDLDFIKSDSVSCMYHTHTLEHIKDDAKALSEMRRVLKDDGKAFVAVPFTVNGTSENLSSNLKPKDRINKFGWHDHWRIYGLDFIERCEAVGFDIEMIQDLDNESIPEGETAFILTKSNARDVVIPETLVLDISNTCNLKCSHCKIHTFKDTGKIDISKYKEIIHEFAEMGGKKMMFHAGEPLIFFDRLVDVSSFGKSMGLQVTVTTNGLRPLSDDDVQTLANSCTHIAISIDSRFKEHHDNIRGFEGSFNKAMTLMKRIKSIAMRHPPKLVATCVLTNKNLPDFAAYVRFMLSQGFDEVGFSLLEPTIGLGPFKFDQYYEDNKITSVDDFRMYMDAASIEGLTVSRQNWETLTEVVKTSTGYSGLCNSSSRNIIVGRDMSIKLCYVKEPVGTWNSTGDLVSIWNSNSAWKRRKEDLSCTRVCGSSYCHRKLKPQGA